MSYLVQIHLSMYLNAIVAIMVATYSKPKPKSTHEKHKLIQSARKNDPFAQQYKLCPEHPLNKDPKADIRKKTWENKRQFGIFFGKGSIFHCSLGWSSIRATRVTRGLKPH